MGLNLAVFVPGHSRRFPVTHLDFWPPGVRVYFGNETVNLPLGEFGGLIGIFSSGRLSLVSLKLQQASAYYIVLLFFLGDFKLGIDYQKVTPNTK